MIGLICYEVLSKPFLGYGQYRRMLENQYMSQHRYTTYNIAMEVTFPWLSFCWFPKQPKPPRYPSGWNPFPVSVVRQPAWEAQALAVMAEAKLCLGIRKKWEAKIAPSLIRWKRIRKLYSVQYYIVVYNSLHVYMYIYIYVVVHIDWYTYNSILDAY